jgi:hypothetical protein
MSLCYLTVDSHYQHRPTADVSHLITVHIRCSMSHGCAVSIVTGYGLDDGGIRVLDPVGSRILTPYRSNQL